MADKALSYWTDTVVDASPDHNAQVIIGRIVDVAGNPYGQHVAMEVTVGGSAGADTASWNFTVYVGDATGDIIGPELILCPVTASIQSTVSFVVQGQIPVGVMSLVVVLSQDSASADASITSLTAVAFVGS